MSLWLPPFEKVCPEACPRVRPACSYPTPSYGACPALTAAHCGTPATVLEILESPKQWARQQLDDFHPDLVIVFGDDQYENFREDGVPAFQINCFEAFEARPWEHARPGPNAWNEAPDTVFRYQANRRAAKHLVTRLIEEGFEVAYAYEPRHEAMPHAILNTLLFLDWDRRGFAYPIVPSGNLTTASPLYLHVLAARTGRRKVRSHR